MQEFDLATQNFLSNHVNHIGRELAVALISQFGGEDALMHEYVMALPNSIEIENVVAFIDDKVLADFYTKHKESIIAFGWKCAAKQGYKYPIDLYVELKSLSEFNENQVVAGMHEENSHLYPIVSSEIVRFSAEQLCNAWCLFNKQQDDFGEQLFNTYHG